MSFTMYGTAILDTWGKMTTEMLDNEWDAIMNLIYLAYVVP